MNSIQNILKIMLLLVMSTTMNLNAALTCQEITPKDLGVPANATAYDSDPKGRIGGHGGPEEPENYGLTPKRRTCCSTVCLGAN